MVALEHLLVIGHAALTLASPINLTKRQGTTGIESVVCGGNTYGPDNLDAAATQGCVLWSWGRPVGRNRYPHTYSNREGLPFATGPPYQEFPIVFNGVYDGGDPGADRIVFNPTYNGECVYVGAMTHTSAMPRNAFVSCTTNYVSE